jgi:hypothetical protein
MLLRKHAAMLGSLMVSSLSFAQVSIDKLTVWEAPKPAFLYLDNTETLPSLMVTSFRVFGSDQVYTYPNISQGLADSSSLESVDWGSYTWPNEIKPVPAGVAGDGYYTVAGGFLVPGSSTGAIELLNPATGDRFKVSTDKSGFFYHHVIWQDINQDGRMDILTARGQKGMFGGSDGELIWLEQPGSDAEFKQPWTEHVITKGPDVSFTLLDVNQDGQQEIIAAEFFSEKLTMYQYQLASKKWQRTLIADDLGPMFHVEATDLNRDGRQDLLVTNHVGNSDASVYAFEVPENPFDANWPMHTLLTGIETTNPGFNQASPGAAQAFYPDLNDQSGKPWIMVAGDGSQKAHLLKPVSEGLQDWKYEEEVLLDTGSTVGHIAIGDVTGDGLVEIFVPAYDADKIYVLHAVK